MCTPIPTLAPQVIGYQSQSQAWNSPGVRKRGLSEWVQILGRKEKARKKSNDTGTEKKTGKPQDMGKS